VTGSGDFELNPAWIGSRRNGKVVLQLLMASVVNQINSRVHIPIPDSGVGRNIGVPLGRISTDKVIDPAGQWAFS
jgi:hypothetical protein